MAGADVVVVGAGLAGLACARVLAAARVEVAVLEAFHGVERTDLVDGVCLDRGFRVLLAACPEARRQLDLTASTQDALVSGRRTAEAIRAQRT